MEKKLSGVGVTREQGEGDSMLRYAATLERRSSPVSLFVML